MIGKSLLHYDIKSIIGKGGMGEVYSATDTKLGRDVAIKILPVELSGDPEREARFQREARALASLQHTNVASIYGFEEADGVRFLVMELISGAELSDRMKKGPIPVDEALAIARQIAAGLEAAHESGIVHRDLKPANIMETDEGDIKILDFGLAQAWFGDTTSEGESSTSMPTITAAMTQAGAILGTAAYMSPEQARGNSIDRRSDIWAFGVILFEMLTGQKLFQGETVSDTLAAVLRAEPDWDSLPRDDHPMLCRLIERCLERNPKQRLRDIGEARIFLQDGGASGVHLSFSQMDLGAVPSDHGRARMPVTLMAILALVCLTAGTFLGWQVLQGQDPAPILHTMIPPPYETNYDLKGTAPGPAAISPDGTMVTFSANNAEGITMLFLRHLDKGESVALSGTESAAYPFWSPDSRFIGFFDMGEGKLRKVAVAGGPPVTLCPSANGKGGTWNDQGVILFAPDYNTPIHRVPDIGGDPVPITPLAEEYDSHRHPRFLPDGRQFIFTARYQTGDEISDVFLASLDTTITPRIITDTQAHAEYVEGHLMTVREGVLMATPFTPDRDRVTEGGMPLVENILVLQGAAVAVFSPSSTGMLVYQTGASAEADRMLYWTDIENGSMKPLGETGQLVHPVISPDGTRALVKVDNASNEGQDLWLIDLETGLRTRFTFAVGDEMIPVWSRSGEYVFYASLSNSAWSIVQQPVEGQGGAAIILESERTIAPSSVGIDDQFLLVDVEREDGLMEMKRLSLTGNSTELELVAMAADGNLGGGQYSPDGRWIAYHTESASGWDIFVIPAAGGARKWQITTDGGVYPRWNQDGTELWVSKFNGDLRAYAVDGSGDTFRAGTFRQPLNVNTPDVTGNYYDLHPDGLRILQTGIDPEFQVEVSYLHLVTDWQRGLVK